MAFGSANGVGAPAGLLELAGLTALMASSAGSDDMADGRSQENPSGGLASSAKKGGDKGFQAPLLRHNNSNGVLESSAAIPKQL